MTEHSLSFAVFQELAGKGAGASLTTVVGRKAVGSMTVGSFREFWAEHLVACWPAAEAAAAAELEGAASAAAATEAAAAPPAGSDSPLPAPRVKRVRVQGSEAAAAEPEPGAMLAAIPAGHLVVFLAGGRGAECLAAAGEHVVWVVELLKPAYPGTALESKKWRRGELWVELRWLEAPTAALARKEGLLCSQLSWSKPSRICARDVLHSAPCAESMSGGRLSPAFVSAVESALEG
jgi:hypothetical protein